MNLFKKTLTMLLIISISAFTLLGCQKKSKPVINIAAQQINEAIVLAHMSKILIEEDLGLQTTINTEFQGSSVLHQAMLNSEIDLYPTWTGTQLTGILRYEGENLPKEETYKKVKESFEKEFDMTWSKPFGFNNTYVYVVKKSVAEEKNLKKSSDLAPYASEWKLACDKNFDTRIDAYPGWSKKYGIEFKELLPMQYGLIYRAIDSADVDIAVAYATDSRIKKLDLAILEDDKEFFPDYSGAYVIDKKTLEKSPKVLDTVNKLGGLLTNEEMVSLNLRYDEGEKPEVIARDFLEEKGLVEKK